MTVYPSWTFQPYTITYIWYGGGTKADVYDIANDKVLDYVPEMTNFIFFRWYDKPMGDGFQPTTVNPITNIAHNTVYGDITIYAKA